MKEKDIAEKILLAYDDVFADIINAVFFKGKEVVKEEELREAAEVTQFKDDGGVHHEQIRDLAKFWEKEGVVYSFFGVENQTNTDKDMILRVLAYDGASYKKQIGSEDIYPVQTLVIYWGKDRWTAPRSLRERIDRPDYIKELITDYSYKLIDMTRLSEEDLKEFKSDFRQVAEIVAKDEEYEASEEELKHPEAVLDLLSLIVRDERFTEIRDKVDEVKKEGRKVSMCALLDKIENRGYTLGEQRGYSLGEQRGYSLGEQKGYSLGVVDGEQKGYSLGITEGEERGREIGKEIGREETARNMKKKGYEIKIIMELTGLNEERVRNL